MGYTPSFTPQYENGWEDLPSETSPITAEALNAYDDAIENVEEYLASDESQANLADAYDETATYEAGDYVIYGGDLYKCLEDIDEPEEWDSTKWESCLITDEMATSGGTNVIANPSGQATETLTKLQVEETIYGIGGGGGSANIWEGTQAELEEQFDDIPNETAIIVIDDEQEVVEGGTIYSEEEQVIGLWTDNKPIYQKTFVTEKTNIVGNTAIDVNSDITPLNVGDIIGYENKLEYSLSGGTGKYWSDDLARLRQDNTNGYTILLTIGGATLTTLKIEWTIQYTKSTDAPLDVVVGKSTMYIASSDCYSTEEKEVGCWSNGKPIYQKVLTTTQAIPFTANTWVKTEFAKGDMDTIIGGFLLFDGQTPSFHEAFSFGFIDGLLAINTTRAWQAEIGARLVIQYTKTTDTAGSGQYTPASGKAVHYSTDEQVIGTWIDGSMLYRKVYAFNENVTISMTSWTNVNSYISNIGFSTFVRCYGIDANGTYQGEILCGLDANNQLQMLSPRNGNASIAVTKIILEYTKSV